MSSIVVLQLTAEGALRRAESAHHEKSSEALRVQVEPSALVSVQIDGVALTGKETLQGRKTVLKKKGKNLLLLVDDEPVLGLLDFYALQGVSIEGDSWVLAPQADLRVQDGSLVASALDSEPSPSDAGAGSVGPPMIGLLALAAGAGHQVASAGDPGVVSLAGVVVVDIKAKNALKIFDFGD